MNVATRLAAFAAVIGLAFGGAVLAGAALDPTWPGRRPARRAAWQVGGMAGMAGDVHAGHGVVGAMPSTSMAANGLAMSSEGLMLAADRTFFAAGRGCGFGSSMRTATRCGISFRSRAPAGCT